MKSAELKEILEIFILKLDENSAELKNSNQILDLIDKKTIEIKGFQPKINPIQLEQFFESQRKLNDSFEYELGELFSKNKNDLQIILKKHQNKYSYNHILIAFIVLHLFCFGFLSYGLNQNAQKNDFEKEMQRYKYEAISRDQFIKEKGLVEKYKKWTEK